MNLPNFLCDGFAHFSTMPVWSILLFKATLILSIAWLIHFSLARANPRWRIFLWRGFVVGFVLSAIWTLGLPGFEIRMSIPEPIPMVSPSYMQPFVAGQNAAVSLNTFDHSAKMSIQSAEYSKPSVSWPIVFLGIWVIGMVVLVFRLAIGYIRLTSLLRSSKPAPEAVVAEARRITARLGCRRAMPIHSSRKFAIPFLYGLLRPVVVLPERMCETAHSGQLSGILAHELAHMRSFDLLWNAAMQVISVALWFHPLAWRMGSAHRSSCDAVCDAVSASFIGNVQDYCRTLAQVALEAPVPAISFGLSMAKGCDVRRRLAVLKRKVFAAPLKRSAVVGAAIIGLSVLTLVAGLKIAMAETPPKASEDKAVTESEHKTPDDSPILGGIVRDEQGQPISNAEVKVYGRKSRTDGLLGKPPIDDTVKTDAEGKWQSSRVPKDLSDFYLIIEINHPGFASPAIFTTKNLSVNLGIKNLSIGELRAQTMVLIMRKGIVVEGAVTDPQGKPVAEAQVGIMPEPISSSAFPKTKTDEKGHYHLAVSEPGEYSVAAAAKDYAPISSRVTIIQKPETVNLQLRKGEMIRLRVVDKDGRPLAGVMIRVPIDTPEKFLRDNGFSTTTDADGRWSKLWIPNDALTLYISKQGYIQVQKKIAPNEREQVITLEAGEKSVSGSIMKPQELIPPAKAPMGAMQPLPLEPDDVMSPLKGTVVDLEGKPVSGAEVKWAYGVSPPDFGATKTDAAGKFTIPGLDAGSQPEIVAFDRRRKLKGHLIISTTPQDDVKIMLLPTGTITGRVTDGKAPIPKVNVDLSARVETIPGNTANYNGIASTVTDADGRYKFEMVEAARDHIVGASAEGYTSDTSSKPLMVGADETVKIRDFEIQRGNMVVTGIVVDPDGNPLEGVRVRAIERTSRPVYSSLPPPTGKDGRFTISNLPNKELILSVDDYHPRANNIPIMFPTLAEVGPGQTEARIVVDPKILHKSL